MCVGASELGIQGVLEDFASGLRLEGNNAPSIHQLLQELAGFSYVLLALENT